MGYDPGRLRSWLVPQAEAGWDFLLFEDDAEPGMATSLHNPSRVRRDLLPARGVDTPPRRRQPGRTGTAGIAVIPRNVPHTFLAQADGARMLSLHTPGGGKDFN